MRISKTPALGNEPLCCGTAVSLEKRHRGFDALSLGQQSTFYRTFYRTTANPNNLSAFRRSNDPLRPSLAR